MGCQKGLTLLELVMGLAVFALLCAMALPPGAERLQRQRLVTAAESLAADLMEARFEAARTGQAWQVTATYGAATGQWCWVVSPRHQGGATGCDCGAPPACPYHRVHSSDHPGVQLLQPGQAQLTGDGQGIASLVAVLGSAHGERLRVELLPMGRSRICVASPASHRAGFLRYAACEGAPL